MAFFKKKKEESQDFKDQQKEASKSEASTEDINIGEKVEVKSIADTSQPSTAEVVSDMSDVAYRALVLDLLVEIVQRLRHSDELGGVRNENIRK